MIHSWETCCWALKLLFYTNNFLLDFYTGKYVSKNVTIAPSTWKAKLKSTFLLILHCGDCADLGNKRKVCFDDASATSEFRGEELATLVTYLRGNEAPDELKRHTRSELKI